MGVWTKKKWTLLIAVIALVEAGCMIFGYYVQDTAGIACLLPVLVFSGLIARSFLKTEPKTKVRRYVGGLAVWFAWNLLTGLCFRIWLADGFPSDCQFKITGYHIVPAFFFLLTMPVSLCRCAGAAFLQRWTAAACYGLAFLMPFCSYVLAFMMNSKLFDAVMSI